MYHVNLFYMPIINKGNNDHINTDPKERINPRCQVSVARVE